MNTKAKPKPVEEKKETAPVFEGVRPITPEEQAIAARVMASNPEWQPLGEDSLVDFNFGRDMFELPPPAKKKQDNREFAFRWVKRTPERIDQLRNRPDPFRWEICNRTNTPYLNRYVDPVTGGVVREDLILMYKPWYLRDKEWAYKRGLADAQDASGMLLNRDGRMEGETGIEWKAGKRSILSGELGHEVRGGDVVMADEEILDERAGIRHQNVTDSDLIVEE